jgi:hypothetical protein
MKAAVSERIQTNSSASVATSMVTDPATLRSAIRKTGTLGVAAPERAQELGGLGVGIVVVPSEGPVEEDAVECGIGDDDGQAVLARERLDDLYPAAPKLLDQGAHAAAGGRSSPALARRR